LKFGSTISVFYFFTFKEAAAEAVLILQGFIFGRHSHKILDLSDSDFPFLYQNLKGYRDPINGINSQMTDSGDKRETFKVQSDSNTSSKTLTIVGLSPPFLLYP
jgi:hypothetical protein